MVTGLLRELPENFTHANQVFLNKLMSQLRSREMDVKVLIDKIEDWIADTAQKDYGAVFWKDTEDDARANITYGDLRKLLKIIEVEE